MCFVSQLSPHEGRKVELGDEALELKFLDAESLVVSDEVVFIIF